MAAFGAFGDHSAFGGSASSPDNEPKFSLSYIFEPPDFSTISDPSLAVCLKSVLKRDSTTKEKALEELETLLTPADYAIEDSFLAIWTRLYPRLAIELSRKVRSLSHTVQALICRKLGSKSLKPLKVLAPSWILGLYDTDRLVSKNALASFSSVFNTKGKQCNVWIRYQSEIIAFVENALYHETSTSLSDDRYISKDDADAKYIRLVVASIKTLTHLIAIHDNEVLEKDRDQLENLINYADFKKFICSDNVAVSRAALKLSSIIVTRLSSWLDISGLLSVISKSITSINELCLNDFVLLLISISESAPQVWYEGLAKGKPLATSVFERLKSDKLNSTPEFWTNLETLAIALPSELSLKFVDNILGLYTAHPIRPSEAGFPEKWRSLLHICEFYSKPEADESCHSKLRTILDLPNFHLLSISSQILKKEAFLKLINETCQTMFNIWLVNHDFGCELIDHVTNHIIDSIHSDKSPLDEYFIVETASHLAENVFSFCSTLGGLSNNRFRIFIHSNEGRIVDACITQLSSDGPSLLAVTILRLFMSLILERESSEGAELTRFSSKVIPVIISRQQTPEPYIDCLIEFCFQSGKGSSAQYAWEFTASELVSNEQNMGTQCLSHLLQSCHRLSGIVYPVRTYEDDAVAQIALLDTDAYEQTIDLLRVYLEAIGVAIGDRTAYALLEGMRKALREKKGEEKSLLKFLAGLDGKAKSLAINFVAGDANKDLISKLWDLQHEDESVGPLLQELEFALSELDLNSDQGAMLRDGVKDAVLGDVLLKDWQGSKDCLKRSLVLLDKVPAGNSRVKLFRDLLFSTSSWSDTLVPFINSVDTSVANTNPLAGTIFLIQTEGESPNGADPAALARIVSHVLRLILEKPTYFKALTMRDRHDMFIVVSLAVEILKDIIEGAFDTNLSDIFGDDWSTEAMETEALNIISLFREFTVLISHGCDIRAIDWTSCSLGLKMEEERYGILPMVLCEPSLRADPPTGESYYTTRGLASLAQISLESAGLSNTELADLLSEIRASGLFKRSPLIFTGLIYGLICVEQGSDILGRLRNETASDILGEKLEDSKALETVIKLNLLLSQTPSDYQWTPTPRAMMIYRRLLSWYSSSSNVPLKTEIVRLVASMAKMLASVSGPHWNDTIQVLQSAMSTALIDSDRPEDAYEITNCERLFSTLVAIKDTCHDLSSEFSASARDLYDLNIQIFTQIVGRDPRSGPSLDMITRLLINIPLEYFDDENGLQFFPLINNESEQVRGTVFQILRKIIPRDQENLAIELALSKDDDKEQPTVELPSELLSLIMDSVPPEHFNGYFLAWILAFTYFSNTTLQVRQIYLQSLRDGDYIDRLMDIIFDLLMTGGNLNTANGMLSFEGGTRLMNLKEFDISAYEPEKADDDMFLLAWEAVHVYYLALLYTPSIVKEWWSKIKNRQFSSQIEKITATFFSPLIINRELDIVRQEMGPKTDKDDNLHIKISEVAKEVKMSYDIDEQAMEMMIKVPDSFPLRDLQVVGVQRVGVKENQWRAWILASQAIVSSQNGGIVDALDLFIRNLTLHFEGVTECAICYSILHQDHSLPTKKCPTCKHKFHAGCLYKWFKNSNGSTCPLCRTNFVMTR